MTAVEIVELLEVKHREDVFVSECKNGPSQSGSHVRLDGWAMNKSWAHPQVTGYEVKVSRADFLGDKKWRAYLPMCNELYFVAPKGIIRPDELPVEVGLMESVGSKRLITRKRAHFRELQIPDDVFRYILMCRVKVCRSYGSESNKAGFWEDWLDQKREERKLGYQVSKSIREHVENVEEENRALKARMKEYDSVRQFIKSIGLDPDVGVWDWDVKRRYKALNEAIPEEFTGLVGRLKTSLEEMQTQLKAIQS